MEKKPSHLAAKALREAIKAGFPIEFRVSSDKVLIVKNRRGAGIIYATLKIEEDILQVRASAEPYSVWHYTIAIIKGDMFKPILPNIPRVVAQHPNLLSSAEADVWAHRLSNLDKLIPADSVPSVLSPYRALGAKVYYLQETGDYVAMKEGVIIAWYNIYTGKLDDNMEYLLKHKLL
jgi:hypothetical protein